MNRVIVEDVVRYLVLKTLAGRSNAVRAIYMYFVEQRSPRDISAITGLSRNQVKGLTNRLMKYGKNGELRRIVEAAYPALERIVPIVVPVNDEYGYCRACNRTVRVWRNGAEIHVMHIHGALLDTVSRDVVQHVFHRLGLGVRE